MLTVVLRTRQRSWLPVSLVTPPADGLKASVFVLGGSGSPVTASSSRIGLYPISISMIHWKADMQAVIFVDPGWPIRRNESTSTSKSIGCGS